MGNPSFSPAAHFESKIKQEAKKDASAILHFAPPPFIPKTVVPEKGLRKILKDRFSFEDFTEINSMHQHYIRKLKGTLLPSVFLDILYKAELTGAKINIAGKEGIVVEERKSTLCVIFKDNKVKLFPKNVWNFTFPFEGVNYLFICKSLKKNRSITK
ncbi:hypothetical protein GINT2_001636 [Glugoides intestinalis]